MAVLLIASFAGNIDTMSEGIGKINELKQNVLNEKIDIISYKKIDDTIIVTITNYGKTDTEIIALFSDTSTDNIVESCTSNNLDDTLSIPAGELLEVTCPASDGAKMILIVTDTRNILEVKLDGAP